MLMIFTFLTQGKILNFNYFIELKYPEMGLLDNY
jgi:hypothetical protein